MAKPIPDYIPAYAEDLSYSPFQDRIILSTIAVEGVVNGFFVEKGTGTQVNVRGGEAYVSEGGGGGAGKVKIKGSYFVPLEVATNTPSNVVSISGAFPQVAQIILRVYDVKELGIAGASVAKIEWLNGTPTEGATIANLKGAAVLPAASLQLAYVLVPKSATSATEYTIKNTAPYVGPVRARGGGVGISWGSIEANGSFSGIATAGSFDFESEKNSTGVYTIKWIISRGVSTYAMTVTPLAEGSASLSSVAAESVKVTTLNAAGAKTDMAWRFIAIG